MDSGEGISEMMLNQLAQIPEWMEHAACAESDLDPFWDQDREAFKAMCKECPVLTQCRERFTEIHNGDQRSINSGTFHGKDYSEE